MRRQWNLVLALLLGAGLTALPSCMQPSANPYQPGAAPLGSNAPLGNSSGTLNFAPPAPTSSAPPLANGVVDQSQSRTITDYLRAHQLPLVGAQLVSAPGGQRQVILFGYTATDFGRSDAESKVRKYLNDPNLEIANRIQVSPELANASPSDTQPPPPSTSTAPVPGDIGTAQDYQNQGAGGPNQHSFGYYSSSSGSGLTAFLPLLGLMMGGGSSFGGGFGGGGFGSGMGSFGGGSYGYPTPPPGYGPGPSPYSPFP
ncbi:MAG TPA: hypothetical protein VEJ86_08405 [Candidatus Binataceae bacterium]|nr:hypothetical protein [Candidatus Binataceae bacterium]